MAALKCILVPVDGSAPSLAALEHAIVLAEDGDTHVDLLHITAPEVTAPQVTAPEEFSVGSTSPLAPSGRQESERALDAAFEQARARLGGRISRRTVSGDPLRTIVETTREGRYDLVVLGTHGRIGRLHAILGSVAEGVVRNAPCPVLTVREAGGGYQSFAERRHGRPSLADPSR